MCGLNKLPDVLVMEVLSNFCLLENVAKLDSALTTHRLRNWFSQNVLQNNSFTLEDDEQRSELSDRFDWIRRRKIKLASLYVVSLNGSEFNYGVFLDLNFSMLCMIYIKNSLIYQYDYNLSDVFRKCPELVELHLTGLCLVLDDSITSNKLQKLVINSCDGSVVMDLIQSQRNRLQYLDIHANVHCGAQVGYKFTSL